MVLLWVATVSYGCLDRFKERVFNWLRRRADPTYDPEAFDEASFTKWLLFEQVFDLLCVVLLVLPGWLALVSSWRFLLSLSFPRFRKKATRLVALYLAMERGYRISGSIGAALERNWTSLLSHATVLGALFFSPSTAVVAGFLLMRQFAALWQSLFTLFNLDNLLPRKWFTAVLNAGQLLLILCNLELRDAAYMAMAAVYVFQCARSLYGMAFN
jgi:hypothetical protein